jgi:hypothetical protein
VELDQLVIAEGSEWETIVYDVRTLQSWSEPSGPNRDGPPTGIYWHHSVSRCPHYNPVMQYEWLVAHIPSGTYGWPYQFVVFPAAAGDGPRNIFYLNDVDTTRPHTYGHNADVAICAIGNYETDVPDGVLPGVMWHLGNGLQVMWGCAIPIYGHRDVYATACPGKHLYAALMDLQRGTP